MALGRRTKTDPIDDFSLEKKPAQTETFLDEGCALSGELRFAENVRIDGKVEGEMWAQKDVLVGERAEIHASIEAQSIEVHGTVLGDIRVAEQTTLHKSARVEGEIQTSGIVIEPGARFKGRIVIGSDDEAEPARAPSESTTPAHGGNGSASPDAGSAS